MTPRLLGETRPASRACVGRATVYALAVAMLAAACAGPRSVPSVPRAQGPAEPFATGRASWYGRLHHGKPTASGEIFDMHALTAAHRSLPIGTRILVVNLSNGRSVEVRVNDRGPALADRIIDLSYAAARRLGGLEAGVFPVSLTVVPE